MPVVIPFSPRQKASARITTAAATPHAAQILFFTGVRYERQVEPAPAASQTARRRRPRPIRSAGSAQPA